MKPILFKGEMVRAILDGRKTVTRRAVKYDISIAYDKPRLLPDGSYEFAVPTYAFGESGLRYVHVKPRYQPGDVLWVRETTYIYGHWNKNGTTKTGKQKWRFTRDWSNPVFYAEKPPDDVKRLKTEVGYFKRPSIFMPREACRLFLLVKSVRVERLREISQEDIEKEGLWFYSQEYREEMCIWRDCVSAIQNTRIKYFKKLWDSINGNKYPWDSNPWVWVIEFERQEEPKCGDG